MKTVDEHLATILAAVQRTSPRRTSLADVHGCVLAAPVRATVAVPGFDNSAMDGYAVRTADVAAATEDEPVTLPVAGEIPAGPVDPAPLEPGTAVRIMTGAPFPKGADTVVQVEWTDGGTETVRIRRAPRRGMHIRRAGDDLNPGDLVLPAGTLLGSAQIGLLAAVNVARPPVHPRPRVAVLSTGSELVDVGGRLGPGQIVDSNSHALAVAARETGAVVRRVGCVPDDSKEFSTVLHELLAESDAIITTGGVSVGAHDVVKEALEEAGEVRFERIAMQPGKPQGFGVIDGVSVFTLPGNPASALVSFELFVRPALRRMRGLPTGPPPVRGVRAGEALRSPAGKRSYLRVCLELDADGKLVASSAGNQGSHQLSSLAVADALLIVPEDVTEVQRGMELDVLMLPDADQVLVAGQASGSGQSSPADAPTVRTIA